MLESLKNRSAGCFVGLILVLFSGKIHAQESGNYFKKMEVRTDTFRLIPALDPPPWSVTTYLPTLSGLDDFQDSLFMLRSLLSFQGDSSICGMQPMKWITSNPKRNDYFVPENPNYSAITIEIEALFIFNLMIEPKPFWLASYPRLQAKKPGGPVPDKMLSLHDDRLKLIYDYYWAWLRKCESKGTFNIGYYPLDNSGYSWL